MRHPLFPERDHRDLSTPFPSSPESPVPGPCRPAVVSVAFCLWRCFLLILTLCASWPSSSATAEENAPWHRIDRGMEIAEFPIPRRYPPDDARITVLRIDPDECSFVLLSASEEDNERKTISQWAKEHQLLAAINAGMFLPDGITSVGYMKNFKHVNNAHVSRHNAVLAFNPTNSDLPDIQIIDRECQDFSTLKRQYQTMIQSIRMISCKRENVWKQQDSRWNTAAVALDEDGNVLFLFSPPSISVHDFADMLLELPIAVSVTMYMEGGPQASFFVSSGDFHLEKHGHLDTGFEGELGLQVAFPIPNVVGVVRREAQ